MKDDTVSRQAALDALADYIHNVDRVYSTGQLTHEDCMDAAHSVLDELPSAQRLLEDGTLDAVEVVRCKDCRHHHYQHGIPYCDRIDYGYGWQDYDFCSRGERKDGDGNG